jgi:hypothetical protein
MGVALGVRGGFIMKSFITIFVVASFAILAGCEKSAKEEANEAIKEMKQGDGKQAVEEAGEAMEKGAKDAGDSIKDATR